MPLPPSEFHFYLFPVEVSGMNSSLYLLWHMVMAGAANPTEEAVWKAVSKEEAQNQGANAG